MDILRNVFFIFNKLYKSKKGVWSNLHNMTHAFRFRARSIEGRFRGFSVVASLAARRSIRN